MEIRMENKIFLQNIIPYYQFQQDLIQMSFLATVNMDPHIHLHILSLAPSSNSLQHLNQKIYFLAKTRRFDELLTTVSKLPNNQFASLKQQIEEARKKTEQQKKQLNDDNIDEHIEKMDIESQNDEADNKDIDEGQMKIYKLAKIYYDQGNFQKAYDIIKKLEGQCLNADLYIKTTWARLYCEILVKSPKAKKTLEHLKKKIVETEETQREDLESDAKQATNIASTHRCYARKEQFLNLSILVYFSDPTEEDFQKFVDLVTQRDYFSVAQLTCPHILKYLCVSYIMNKTLHKNRQYDLFMLLEIIRRKIMKYNDPFVEFLQALNIHFDFEESANKIKQLKAFAESDPLIANLSDKIVQNCYFLFYKVYCKVYDKVAIQKIADFTGKSVEDAQIWILGFIRSLDIEAKIDSVDGVVMASKDEESLNEKYIDLLPKARGFISDLESSLN